jgi:hypothetical protein
VFPTVYPWVQAFIWAFKPTDVVDIRRFPRQEAAALRMESARRRRGRPAATKASRDPKRHTL